MSTSVTFNGTTYSIPASGETGWSSLSAFLIDVANNAQTLAAQKGAIRIATSTPVTISSTDYTVLSNLTVAGAVAFTLPIGVDKTIYVIGDTKGDAQTNNITISPNSGTINGAATYVIKDNYGCVALQYSTAATEWKVIGRYFTKINAATEVFGLLSPANGGTGVANNAASTLTISGNYATTLTVSGVTSLTLPTSGTVATTSNKLSAFAATTSAELAGVISDETGSGALVFANTPTLVTPVLGVASATSINKLAITAPASGSTLAVADGKTFTVSNTLTLTGTDTSSVAFGAGGTVAYVANTLGVFAATTSAQLAGVISDETGSGALVFATSPTLVTPTLGVATATSINKMAITAPASSSTLAVADGKTFTASNTLTLTGTDGSTAAFGAGGTVAYTGNKLSVFAATSSSELAGVISDETGSGALMFGTSPTITTALLMGAAAETRYYNAGGTFYVGFKGGNAAANKIWTLPTADGSGNQALSTDGSGNLIWQTVASASTASPTSQGLTTSYFPTIQSAVKIVSSANYTILTTDGYQCVLVTTGASDRTIDLPAAASNTGRILEIVKVDSGAGFVLVDGNSSETIDGDTIAYIQTQYDKITLVCDGSNWITTYRCPEYASNSSGTDADDTTSFAYGPSGSQFRSLTAQRTKRVEFKTPFKKGESVTFQTSQDSGVSWDNYGNSGIVYATAQEGSDNYGILINGQSTTQKNIIFGKYRKSGASYASGTDWSVIAGDGTYLWRVKKYRG